MPINYKEELTKGYSLVRYLVYNLRREQSTMASKDLNERPVVWHSRHSRDSNAGTVRTLCGRVIPYATEVACHLEKITCEKCQEIIGLERG